MLPYLVYNNTIVEADHVELVLLGVLIVGESVVEKKVGCLRLCSNTHPNKKSNYCNNNSSFYVKSWTVFEICIFTLGRSSI